MSEIEATATHIMDIMKSYAPDRKVIGEATAGNIRALCNSTLGNVGEELTKKPEPPQDPIDAVGKVHTDPPPPPAPPVDPPVSGTPQAPPPPAE